MQRTSKRVVIEALAVAAILTATTTGIAAALDIGVGDISVSVGTESGLDVGIGIGDTSVGASVGAGGVSTSVGLGGAGVSVGLGGSGVAAAVDLGQGKIGTTTPGTLLPALLAGPRTPNGAEVRAASRVNCGAAGNSSVYTDYIVFDSTGSPVGVVKSAMVGPSLAIDSFTFSTLASFASPPRCVTVADRQLVAGSGALRLSYSGNAIHRAIAGH